MDKFYKWADLIIRQGSERSQAYRQGMASSFLMMEQQQLSSAVFEIESAYPNGSSEADAFEFGIIQGQIEWEKRKMGESLLTQGMSNGS